VNMLTCERAARSKVVPRILAESSLLTSSAWTAGYASVSASPVRDGFELARVGRRCGLALAVTWSLFAAELGVT
jgi:hypothetical protein